MPGVLDEEIETVGSILSLFFGIGHDYATLRDQNLFYCTIQLSLPYLKVAILP